MYEIYENYALSYPLLSHGDSLYHGEIVKKIIHNKFMAINCELYDLRQLDFIINYIFLLCLLKFANKTRIFFHIFPKREKSLVRFSSRIHMTAAILMKMSRTHPNNKIKKVQGFYMIPIM